jgi:hypothetical protein
LTPVPFLTRSRGAYSVGAGSRGNRSGGSFVFLSRQTKSRKEVVLVATLPERHTERSGLSSWSLTRWLVVLGGVAAVIVAIVLIVMFAGGGGSGGGGAPGY